MPTMVLRFPGGRYHATTGGHHVNEGVVEWPPSPWRLVRALIACGYATQHWEQVPADGRRLVEALSSVLPEYRLPRAALGHSRHYMPIGVLENGREKTTLVLDTFADVGDGALWVRWPVRLDEEARRLFEVLVAHIGYLGRSESWVVTESVSDDIALPESGRAFPDTVKQRPCGDFEQITLTAPTDPGEYRNWRQHEVDGAISVLSLGPGKKATKAQEKKKIDTIQDAYPADLIDCFQRDTAWWQARKWSQAPGTRSVLYWREGRALEVGPPSSPQVSDVPPVEMMLLALMTPSGSKSPLPSIARTLPQAELLHQAVVSKLDGGGVPCPELVGRDESGEPLKGHKHTHLLPIDLDRDGHLDHVILWAPVGLSARAQWAIRSLRRTYRKGGVQLQVAVSGVGTLSDLRAIGARLANAIEKLLGPTGGATSWVSATPFVPPRHLKKHGRSSLAGQVEAELKVRGFPPANVEILDWTAATLALRHFVRRRRRGPQPPIDVGFALRLRFDSPIVGPICIGYGSHFGLGRFSAA